MFPNIPAKARALNAKLVKMWKEGFDQGSLGTSQIMDVARMVPADSGENVYLFPQELRGMRTRAAGSNELIPDAYNVFEASILNKDRYRVLDVPLNDFKNDRIGQYSGIAASLGKTAASGPFIDLEELVENGDVLASAPCYDQKALFATDHPVDPTKAGSPAFANKIVQSGGLTIDNFGLALAVMTAFPSATPGKAVGSRPSHLAVSSGYEGVAIDVCKSRFPTGLQGAENKWLGLGITPIVVPNWSREMFVLFDARDPDERAIIFQEREPLALVPNGIDPNGAMEYERNALRWIVKGQNGVGAGIPHKALLSVKS
ncbi:MAG: Mu-like prophage major head subunit gpT family protein [Polyangiaceae bacterium]